MKSKFIIALVIFTVLIILILLFSFFGFFIGLIFPNHILFEFNLTDFYSLAGIISGLFGALAFIGVLWFNYRQIQDAKLVSFENTFFKMVSIQLEIVNELEYIDEKDITDNKGNRIESIKKIVKGRQVFKFLFEEVETKSISDVSDNGMRGVLDRHELEDYTNVEYIGIFDHYFRNLYRIIKFVDEQNNSILNHKKKYDYLANNVRSILSEYELIWLYYNCLNEVGNEKFKPLSEKYTLFKNLREDKLANSYKSKRYKYQIQLSNLDLSNIKLREDDSSGYEHYTYTDDFPTDEYEYYMNIDDTEILDKYNIRAFHSDNKEVEKFKNFYLDMKNGLSREESSKKNL